MSLDRINLYKVPAKKTMAKKPEDFVAATMVVVFLSSLCLTYLQYKSLKKNEAERAQLEATHNETKQKAVLLSSQNASSDSRKIASVNSFINGRKLWADVFKELTLLLEKDIWLTSLSANVNDGQTKVSINGLAVSQALIRDFSLALEESYYFRNVKLKSAEKIEGMDPTVYRFQFECKIGKFIFGREAGSEK